MPGVVDLAAMREAMRRPRRRPGQDQPARAGRAGHRPLGDRRRVRHAPTRSPATSSSSTSATTSATSSCAGARARSTTSRSCRPAPASCTRSTSSTWPGSCSRATTAAGLPRHAASAPTRTPRWSTASACSAGASAASRPRRPCSASRSRCSSRGWSASSSPASCPRAPPPPTWCSPITEMLRKHGVVGKFVEFYGPGVAAVPLANRATIGNMSPGVRLDRARSSRSTTRRCATCGSPAAPRSRSRWSRRTPRSRASGTTRTREPRYSETLELDLSTVVPSLAGPKRPQDRVPLTDAKPAFRDALPDYVDRGSRARLDEASAESFPASDPPGLRRHGDGQPHGAAAPAADGRPRNPIQVTLEDGTTFERRPRRRRDRRDHVAAPTRPTRR